MTPSDYPSGVIRDPLTERQRAVVSLYAAGYDYHEIAAQLFITASAVQNHLTNAGAKLHCPRHAIGVYALWLDEISETEVHTLIAERLR